MQRASVRITTQATMVTIKRSRKTRVYIMRSLRSSIGPRTRNASLAVMCILVKLAATNASASLHKHIRIARSIIAGMARKGSSRENFSISSVEMYDRASAARTAPRIKKTVISTKSWRAVEEIFPRRMRNVGRCSVRAAVGAGKVALAVAGASGRTVWVDTATGVVAGMAIGVKRLLPYLRYWMWTTSAVMEAMTKPNPNRNPTISGAIL